MDFLKIKTPRKFYTCDDKELYAILMLAWYTCKYFITYFNSNKSKYTNDIIKKNIEEIIKANNTPEYDDIMNDLKSKFVDIEIALQKILFEWQILTGYIKKSYPSFMHESKMELAGMSSYNKLNKNKLDYFETFEHDSLNFLNDHSNELIKGLMPEEYPNQYKATIENYKDQLKSFFELKNMKQNEKQNKININNLAYKSTIKMCEDGKTIFSNYPEIKKYFTFNQLLKIVRGKDNNTKLININNSSTICVNNFITFTKIYNIGITKLVISSSEKIIEGDNQNVVIEPGENKLIEMPAHTIYIKNINERINGELKLRVLNLPKLELMTM